LPFALLRAVAYTTEGYFAAEKIRKYMHYEQVTCASAILINEQGHILFHQRDNNPAIAFPNYWALLGGHVEDGETPDEAIERELREEIKHQEPLIFWKSYYFWKTDKILVHQYVYSGNITTPIERIQLQEGQALRFFDMQAFELYQIAFGFDALCKEFYREIYQNRQNKPP
jgi:8-oxo-dGTP diphosphatase